MSSHYARYHKTDITDRYSHICVSKLLCCTETQTMISGLLAATISAQGRPKDEEMYTTRFEESFLRGQAGWLQRTSKQLSIKIDATQIDQIDLISGLVPAEFIQI